MENIYTRDFYRVLQEDARRSARRIVPLVVDLLQPHSVVDAGCGLGSWLATFKEHGVKDVMGVDGAWIDRRTLEIPQEQFLAHDLTQPLRLDRTFDLALSLEAAQHVSTAHATTFVQSLTALAPVVLFSSAIPFQGPPWLIHNGQWPGYWIEQFAQFSYAVIDCVRGRVWDDPDVGPWYAQNILVFVRADYLRENERLQRELISCEHPPRSLVHPRIWLWHKSTLESGLLLRLYSRLAFKYFQAQQRMTWHPLRRARQVLGAGARRRDT